MFNSIIYLLTFYLIFFEGLQIKYLARMREPMRSLNLGLSFITGIITLAFYQKTILLWICVRCSLLLSASFSLILNINLFFIFYFSHYATSKEIIVPISLNSYSNPIISFFFYVFFLNFFATTLMIQFYPMSFH